MPPKRRANGAAPGQPAAQRQRLAPAAPAPAPGPPPPPPPPPPPAPGSRSFAELPDEIKTQIVIHSLSIFDNICAFRLFCSGWRICNWSRGEPQLDEILRKLRVDVYKPAPETLGVQLGEGEEQYFGELESWFAGHSRRKVQCPLFQEGAHGFDNRHCEQCGCVPFEKEVLLEGGAAWDMEWEGRFDPYARGRGGVWTGRLREGMAYRPNEPWNRLVKPAEETGIHAYLNSIRNTRYGRFLTREVKRERALRPDRLIVLQQRPWKWLGRFTERGLGRRVRSGLEGTITWGNEMVGFLPFIEGFTERFDDNGYLRVATGAPASTAAAAAIKARPFDQVKKHLSPEPPNQEPWFLYRHIRHLMITSNPCLNFTTGIDYERFGTIPPTDPPVGTVLANMTAVQGRVFFEHMVPLYVDYQALTNLETLYLDLRNIRKRSSGTTLFQMREVLQLARRLEGKNLRLLVIAGLRTHGAAWWGERELDIEEIEGMEEQNPGDWDDVNWLVEFRRALRPGGKLILVDAHSHHFPRNRYRPWINPRNDPGATPHAVNGLIGMGGFPAFLNNFIDNEANNNEVNDDEVDDDEGNDPMEEFSEEMTASEEATSEEASSEDW
ncbi:hypothetical protein B0H65DRAFT_19135 [Neurospora tetraspora]|uniref:Uncharacterized protein n=1 Tax=Neurospora tetraspora TaxID=94610 RepID=A0AAE0JNI7_9PEZI|nr:hypothetical protein B0H65DRAFT_19135 [Neurospora tetraspora]